MYKSIPKVCFHLSVDNTSLFYLNKSCKKVETDVNICLDNIADWLKTNRLTLNVKKASFLFLTQEKNNKEKPVKLSTNEEEL